MKTDRLQLRVAYGDGGQEIVGVTAKAYVALERKYGTNVKQIADLGSLEALFYLAYVSLKRKDSFDEFFDLVDDIEVVEPDGPADPTGAQGQ